MRIGVVGAGLIARTVHIPVLLNVAGVTVDWVADASDKAARDTARNFRIAAAPLDVAHIDLPPCDCALLSVPVSVREPYLRYFSQRRIPVFAEKPFAISSVEHQRYLDLFGDVPVSVGYMRRTYATVNALQRIVQEGWFGRLRSVVYREGGRTTRSRQSSATLELSCRLGGGVLRDLGCHGVDTVGLITGFGELGNVQAAIEWDGETDRHVQAVGTLSGGSLGPDTRVSVAWTISWLLDQPNTIELHFEHASLRAGIKPGAQLEIASTPDFEDAAVFDLHAGGARSEYQSYYLEWCAALARDVGHPAYDMSAASGLWTTRAVEAIYAVGGLQ